MALPRCSRIFTFSSVRSRAAAVSEVLKSSTSLNITTARYCSRKVKQCLFEKLVQFGSGGAQFWIRRSVDYFHREVSLIPGVFELLVAAPQSQSGQRFVNRNARQSGAKGCVCSKLVKVLIGVDISSLHHVFRFVIVVQDRARNAIQPWLYRRIMISYSAVSPDFTRSTISSSVQPAPRVFSEMPAISMALII